MKNFRYLSNVATLQVKPERCIGCGRCLEVCPHQVLSLLENAVRIVDLDGCMECGACAMNCPADAIYVDAGVGCAKGLINEWLQGYGFGGARKECC